MPTEEIINLLKNDYSKEIIVAIISGLLLLIAQFLYKYIKNSLTYNKYKGYTGEYFTYTVSTKKSRHISCYSYKVKYRFGKLVFSSTDRQLKYSGEVLITDQNVYFNSKGKEHIENNYMIFHKPMNNKLVFSIGAFIGISILNEPTTKVILITDKKIEKKKALKILESQDIKNENS